MRCGSARIGLVVGRGRVKRRQRVSLGMRRRASVTVSARRVLWAAVVGYLFGSLPSADVAGRLASPAQPRDLRDEGSGNPGALNAAQVLGWRWGLGVLAADIAKGAAAAQFGRAVGGDEGAYAAATAAIAGHVAPVWSKFRGGKGIATSAGACLAVFPAYFPVDVGVAAVTAVASSTRRRRSVGRAPCGRLPRFAGGVDGFRTRGVRSRPWRCRRSLRWARRSFLRGLG